MKGAKRIYLDVCCVNRPFDDQGQERIHLETEAIETILLHMEQGEWRWVGSGALLFEATNVTDLERRDRVMQLLAGVKDWVPVRESERQRAASLIALGFKPLDALHIACAESAEVDVVLSTDDRLLRMAARRVSDLRVPVLNPLRWLEEQLT